MHVLAPLLTERYAPLRPNGHGLQSIYLTSLEPAFAEALLTLLGPQARALAHDVSVRDRPFDPSRAPGQGQTEWEEHLIDAIRAKPIEETEKTALILARRGQGLFKQARPPSRSEMSDHRRRSHRASTREPLASHGATAGDSERLDGENGLLLTPSIDHLFDRGFISFETDGRLLVSPVAHRSSLERMGVPLGERVNVGSFFSRQRRYLEFHQERVSWRRT